MVTKTTMNIETSQHMKTVPLLCLTLFISRFILSTQLRAWGGVSEMRAPETHRHRQKDLSTYSLVVPLLPLKCDMTLDTEGVINPKGEEGIILSLKS